MPVVHVRSLAADGVAAPTVLAGMAGAVARAVPCDVGGVWCTFTALDAQTLGGHVIDGEGRILYVDLWMRERDDPQAAGRALEAACAAAAAGFGVPVEDVWGTFCAVEPGAVFAGGRLLA